VVERKVKSEQNIHLADLPLLHVKKEDEAKLGVRNLRKV
jgi:hypothetical protein